MYKITVRRPDGTIAEVIKDEPIIGEATQRRMREATRAAGKGEIISFEYIEKSRSPEYADWLRLSRIADEMRRKATRDQENGLGANWVAVHEAELAADQAWANTEEGKREAAQKRAAIADSFVARGLD
jgi:hypothetical protein